MKINEMQLDEFIPITKKGRAIRRAEKAGSADVKQTVDDLETEFASLLGTQNKRFKSATTDDVISFLKSKKVDTSRIDTTQPMNPKRINQVFTTLVRDKISGANLADPKAPAPTATPSNPEPTKPGLVDKVKNMFKGKSQTAPATEPTAPAQGQAAANPTPTPKASNLNSYFQNFSKEMQGAGDKKQKIALAKELVNIIADRGGEGSEAAVSILRKVGGDLDNNFKQAAMNALKNGQRLLKQSVYFEITKMLREHNLSWSDLGIRVHLLEGTNKVFGISFK